MQHLLIKKANKSGYCCYSTKSLGLKSFPGLFSIYSNFPQVHPSPTNHYFLLEKKAMKEERRHFNALGIMVNVVGYTSLSVFFIVLQTDISVQF